jgi:hypothetical protein
MAKRPTPKKRRAKSKGRAQHAVYIEKQVKKLTNRANSPFAIVAEQKNKGDKALKSVTKIKA